MLPLFQPKPKARFTRWWKMKCRFSACSTHRIMYFFFCIFHSPIFPINWRFEQPYDAPHGHLTNTLYWICSVPCVRCYLFHDSIIPFSPSCESTNWPQPAKVLNWLCKQWCCEVCVHINAMGDSLMVFFHSLMVFFFRWIDRSVVSFTLMLLISLS